MEAVGQGPAGYGREFGNRNTLMEAVGAGTGAIREGVVITSHLWKRLEPGTGG